MPEHSNSDHDVIIHFTLHWKIITQWTMLGNKAKACMTSRKVEQEFQYSEWVGNWNRNKQNCGNEVAGKKYFRVHVLKNNCECHQRVSQRKRTERDITQRPCALWFRVHPYITSQSTHFLNMPHLGSIIRGSSMEGRFGLHLQSAVRWQGDSNENDTGQKWTVNRWDVHKLNNIRMNTWICDWYE